MCACVFWLAHVYRNYSWLLFTKSGAERIMCDRDGGICSTAFYNAVFLVSLNYQDALRESFPDMPREDRQLLMLRFVREVDQSVDYSEVRQMK